MWRSRERHKDGTCPPPVYSNPTQLADVRELTFVLGLGEGPGRPPLTHHGEQRPCGDPSPCSSLSLESPRAPCHLLRRPGCRAKSCLRPLPSLTNLQQKSPQLLRVGGGEEGLGREWEGARPPRHLALSGRGPEAHTAHMCILNTRVHTTRQVPRASSCTATRWEGSGGVWAQAWLHCVSPKGTHSMGPGRAHSPPHPRKAGDSWRAPAAWPLRGRRLEGFLGLLRTWAGMCQGSRAPDKSKGEQGPPPQQSPPGQTLLRGPTQARIKLQDFLEGSRTL